MARAVQDPTIGGLFVACPERLDDVRQFASERGIRGKLEEQLKRLADGERTKCILYFDHAPQSFYFEKYRVGPDGKEHLLYNGGLIYYEGKESGVGAPQFSVTLSGRTDSRWEIHT